MKPIRLPKKRSKYGNVKTMIDGRTFASKAEAEHYLILKDREEKGEIAHLNCQRAFELFVDSVYITSYRADFDYMENGDLVVVDVKGVRTREYILKKKLMLACWGINIREISVKSRGRRKRK